MISNTIFGKSQVRYIQLIVVLVAMLSYTAYGQSKNSKKSKQPLVVDQEVLNKAEMTFIEGEKQLLLENYSKAKELFITTLQMNPNSGAVYFKLAEVHFKAGQLDESIGYMRQALEKDTGNKFYYVFLANIYKAANKSAEAIQTLSQLVEEIPGNESYYLDIAMLYSYEGKNEKALGALRSAEQYLGVQPQIMAEKQKIYLESGRIDDLIKDWDVFVNQNRDEPGYLAEYISVLISNERINEARERLKWFKEWFPTHPAGNLIQSELELKNSNVGEALSLLREPFNSVEIELEGKLEIYTRLLPFLSYDIYKQIFQELLELLKINHSDSPDLYMLAGGVYMELGKLSEAKGHFRTAARLKSTNLALWQNLITMEWEAQEYDSLIQHADQAIELFPSQPIFYFYAGVSYYIQEKHKKSVQLLELGKKYATENTLLSLFQAQLGDAYNSLKEFDKSDKSYESAIQADPTNDHAINNYSYFLSLRKQNLARADELSAQLVARNPQDPTYLDTRAWVLYMKGEYIEAEKILTLAVEFSTDGTILEHLGDVKYKLGKEEEAVKYWEKAFKNGGTSEWIEKKITDRKLYE